MISVSVGDPFQRNLFLQFYDIVMNLGQKIILNKFQTLYSPQKISIIYMYMLAGGLDAIEK